MATDSIFNSDNTENTSRASDIGYSVNIRFMDLEGDKIPWRTNDITSIQVIRNSLEKLASITILTLPLDLIAQQSLELMLKQKKYPRVYIDYQQVDPNKPLDTYSRNYTIKNTFHMKKYRCIQMKTLEKPTVSSRNVMTHLMLCNELVFYLSNSHRYNKIFFDKTLQWILYYIDQKDLPNSGYQGFLRMFGKNSKNENAIWLKAQFPNDFVNKHKYEQVLIKTHNDLHAIKYLMDTYKYTNYPSVVFFDDFYLPTPGREIELMAIMLMHSSHPANLAAYVKFDINQAFFAEAKDSLKMLHNSVINDHSETINYKEEGAETNILINTPGDFIHMSKKLDVSYNIPTSTQSKGTKYTASDELLYTNFKDGPEFDVAVQPRLQSNQSIRTFAVDNHDAQKQRMINCQHLLNTEIEAFYTFESNRIHFDAIQFERIYNFDPADANTFSFVPVIIVNTFTRKDNKDIILRHSCRFQCIRYQTWKPESEYDIPKVSGSDSNKANDGSISGILNTLDVFNKLSTAIDNSFNLESVMSAVTSNLSGMLSSVTGSLSSQISALTPAAFTSAITDLNQISGKLGVNLNMQGIVSDIASAAINGGDITSAISGNIHTNFQSALTQAVGGNALSSAARQIISGDSLTSIGKNILLPILTNYSPALGDLSNIIEKVNHLETGVTNMLSNVSLDRALNQVASPQDLVHSVIVKITDPLF